MTHDLTKRYDTAAAIALLDFERDRTVLVVVRTAFYAGLVMEAIERALMTPATIRRANGRWSVTNARSQRARIDIRVAGPAVRGIAADTLLLGPKLTPHAQREARPSLSGSPSPLLAWW